MTLLLLLCREHWTILNESLSTVSLGSCNFSLRWKNPEWFYKGILFSFSRRKPKGCLLMQTVMSFWEKEIVSCSRMKVFKRSKKMLSSTPRSHFLAANRGMQDKGPVKDENEDRRHFMETSSVLVADATLKKILWTVIPWRAESTTWASLASRKCSTSPPASPQSSCTEFLQC